MGIDNEFIALEETFVSDVQAYFILSSGDDHLERISRLVEETNPRTLAMIFPANKFVTQEIGTLITQMMIQGIDFADAYRLAILSHDNQHLPEELRPSRNNFSFIDEKDIIDPATGEVTQQEFNPWYFRDDIRKFAARKFTGTTRERRPFQNAHSKIEGLNSKVSDKSLKIHRDIKERLGELEWDGNLVYIFIQQEFYEVTIYDKIVHLERDFMISMEKDGNFTLKLNTFTQAVMQIVNELRSLKYGALRAADEYSDILNSKGTVTSLNLEGKLFEYWNHIGNGEQLPSKPIHSPVVNLISYLASLPYEEFSIALNVDILSSGDWQLLAIDQFINSFVYSRELKRRGKVYTPDLEAMFEAVNNEGKTLMQMVTPSLTRLISEMQTKKPYIALKEITGIDLAIPINQEP